jgi:dTMP kinase
MFICFEGIDGSGKSTQVLQLARGLENSGVPVEVVADPGTTRIGNAIRSILLENNEPISSAAQMLLFSAARAELATYIRQRLEAGSVVICDRWLLSTLVYQGVLNGIPAEDILSVFRISADLYPDICFLLDISPAAAKKRMGKPRDRYERRSMQARKKMRDAYLSLAQKNYARLTYVIDASSPVETTARRVSKVVNTIRDMRLLGISTSPRGH